MKIWDGTQILQIMRIRTYFVLNCRMPQGELSDIASFTSICKRMRETLNQCMFFNFHCFSSIFERLSSYLTMKYDPC